MIVVIDTNVLLVSVSSKSSYHWLYKAILDKEVRIAFSHDILTEYEEQLAKHWHPDVAVNVTRSLTELSSAVLINIYYNLKLIVGDEDDNKFVDCAFAANADFIITNDKHFNVLAEIEFPAIPILTINAFHDLLRKEGII